jgi:hypothetical protein
MDTMKENDDKLNALLRQWRDIEPPANFEANVWRRIRLANVAERERFTLSDWLAGLMWRPALGLAAAVIVSALLGSSAAVVTMRRTTDGAARELQFMSAGTLAGAYAQLTGRGAP